MLYADRPHAFSTDGLVVARTVAARICLRPREAALGGAASLAADQLGAALDAVGEGITVQDPQGRLLLANAAVAEILGFSSVEALLAAG